MNGGATTHQDTNPRRLRSERKEKTAGCHARGEKRGYHSTAKSREATPFFTFPAPLPA